MSASIYACVEALNLDVEDDPGDWDASWERRRQIILARGQGDPGEVPPPLWWLWQRPVQLPESIAAEKRL